MRVVRLTSSLREEEVATLAGTFADARHYDLLLQEDADVYTPAGGLLLRFRKRAVPLTVCAAAFPILRTIRPPIFNRGVAGGATAPNTGKRMGSPVKKDGTRSKTQYAGGSGSGLPGGASSGIIGAYDRYQRIPYCRLTAFNLNTPHKFLAVEPYIRAVDAVFARELPERYAAQRAAVAQTHHDWIIQGTAFTTVTVNQNWRTAIHTDAGDLKAGFGVLSVLEAGHYDGAYLVFPRYRVAVDIRTADVLLADVHQWHGNTAIAGVPGRYSRISCVFYFRQRMIACGTPEEELTTAKRRGPGEPLWSAPEHERIASLGEEAKAARLVGKRE